MEKPSPKAKPRILASLTRHVSGPLAPVALSALSGWMIVTGIKGLLGFTVNSQTAAADLVGIAIVIAVARWMRSRGNIR